MRRLKAVVAALLLLPALAVAAGPSSALEQDPILVTAPTDAEQTYTVEYPVGTLVGNEPSSEFHTPDDCAMLPSCARIPVHVQYPENYDRDVQEYFITVAISWDAGDLTVDLPNRPAGQDNVHAQGNDLDNYFYVTEVNEEGETEYRLVAQAATASNPERARWLGGADEYILVIQNWVGVNRGFIVNVKLTPAIFGNPVEDLGTAFRSPSETSGSLSTSPDVTDFESFEPGPAASAPRSSISSTPEPVFQTNPVGLPVIGGDGLDTFGAFGGSNADFESSLDGEAPQLFQPARELGPPKDVPGSLIAFWLGVVPLLLGLAAAAWFWRRRPAALSYTAPTSVPA